MRPEEALDAARAAAARTDYADLPGMEIEPADRITAERLMTWAVIEPDIEQVRSTRRAGAPITWAKRALVHVLRQYLGELTSQQTRFNLNVAIKLAELDDRVARLEETRERPPGP